MDQIYVVHIVPSSLVQGEPQEHNLLNFRLWCSYDPTRLQWLLTLMHGILKMHVCYFNILILIAVDNISILVMNGNNTKQKWFLNKFAITENMQQSALLFDCHDIPN